MLFSTICDKIYSVIYMFFKTQDSIPANMGFKAFDLTHLLWLAAAVVLAVIACTLYRRLDAKKQVIMLRVMGCYIFIQEMLKNVVVAAAGEFSYGYLPFHLCGINILLIVFDIIKPTATVRSFLYFFCIPGAALALLFPNWTETPFFNFFHWHSFLIHILLTIYPLLLVTSGQIKPNFKSAMKSLLLLICLAIPIYFLNLLWGTNFMFLIRPDSGNPLELFEKLLGSHLWGFPILLPIVMFIMYIPLGIAYKHKKSAPQMPETEEREKMTV